MARMILLGLLIVAAGFVLSVLVAGACASWSPLGTHHETLRYERADTTGYQLLQSALTDPRADATFARLELQADPEWMRTYNGPKTFPGRQQREEFCTTYSGPGIEIGLLNMSYDGLHQPIAVANAVLAGWPCSCFAARKWERYGQMNSERRFA
jgi:hypothetical protein